MMKDGYRFVQVLVPVKTHKVLTETSRKLRQSNAETVRVAIDAFLKNPSCKGSEDTKNDF